MRFKVGDLVGFLATLDNYRFAVVTEARPYSQIPYFIKPVVTRSMIPADSSDLTFAVVTFGGPLVVKDR